MTEKDERAEHLDKLMRACAFLKRKYQIADFPELELSPGPIEHECIDRETYYLKGLFEEGKITIVDDWEALPELFHEVMHLVDYQNRNPKMAHTPAADPELEKMVHERALRDLEEFELYESAKVAVTPLRKYLRKAS